MKLLEALAREGRINENASIRDRQSSIVNAPIENVWNLLTNINSWSEWSSEIKSINCEKVEEGALFKWTIRHTKMHSSIQAMKKPNLFAWTGKSSFIKTIFVWNLEESENQTLITVELSVEGLVIPLFNNPSKLHDLLLNWLNALKTKAERNN